MKLKTYIKTLQEIAKKHPNLNVVYSCDDEGNRYDDVKFSPTLGVIDCNYGEFRNIEDGESPDSVCIN